VEKLIILSVVVVSMALPGWLATAARPRPALRRAQILVFLFVIVWAFLCTRWYPQLVPLK
jgi:hypothetical protein